MKDWQIFGIIIASLFSFGYVLGGVFAGTFVLLGLIIGAPVMMYLRIRKKKLEEKRQAV